MWRRSVGSRAQLIESVPNSLSETIGPLPVPSFIDYVIDANA